MKNLKPNRSSWHSLVVAFVFSLMCFGVSAQTFPELVDAPEAQQILRGYYLQQQTEVESATPGTAAAETALRLRDMAVVAYEQLVEGSTVDDALMAAYDAHAVDSNGSKANADELALSVFDNEFSSADAEFDSLVALLER